MAYTTIDKSSLHFNAKKYSGTGSAQSITGVGFQPDWCWIKNASSGSNYSHTLTDAVRGVTKHSSTNNTNAEYTSTTEITSFDSDGFTVGTDVGVNSNGSTLISWNWRASNTTAVSNTDGSITSTVSANTTSGFSIIKYTGTGANASIGTGLGAIPHMAIFKRTDTSGFNWFVYHRSLGAGKFITLDTNLAQESSTSIWQNTTPTSSVITLGGDGGVNASGGTYICYAFTEKKGFSKFGSYIGNGSTDGPMIYTGFKPAFIIAKTYGSTGNWILWDNKRDGYNETLKRVYPNLSTAEESSTAYGVDILSNGFKLRGTASNLWNSGNSTYIYMAFSEKPLVSSNGVPNTAR
jgi:hypothetical protein